MFQCMDIYHTSFIHSSVEVQWHFEDLPNCFPKQLHHFTFPPVMYEDSNFSTSSATLIICLSGYGHSSGCELESHCSFDSQLPNDK